MRINISALRDKIDFGIITIREDEYLSVFDRFEPADTSYGRRTYDVGSINTVDGGHYRFVLVRAIAQGESTAQDVARDIIEDLQPKWLLLVGIGGAVPSADFTLGDVVCATRVHDFCVRAVKEGDRDNFAAAGGPMHKAVEDVLARLPVIERLLHNWNTQDSIGMATPALDVPGEKSDRYYGSKEWQAEVRRWLTYHFESAGKPRPPHVTARPVASSDALIKDSTLLSQWLTEARAVAAVEMELAGVYIAARRHDREYPILAIRGISDIVGFKREEVWTKYACNTSAAFALALITAGHLHPAHSGPAVEEEASGDRNHLQPDLEAYITNINAWFNEYPYLSLYDADMGLSPPTNIRIPRQWEKQEPTFEPTSASSPQNQPQPCDLEMVSQALTQNRGLLLTSDPGIGKSTFLRYLAIDAAQNLAIKMVPILVSGSGLVKHKMRGLAGALYAAYYEQVTTLHEGVSKTLPDNLFSDRPTAGGTWLVLIDALDEVIDEAQRDRLVTWLLDNTSERYRFVVTTRPIPGVDRFTQGGFIHYKLCPLDAEGVKTFVREWFINSPNRDDLVATFTQQLNRLGQLGRIPLFLYMAAIVFDKYHPADQLPTSRTQLYQRYIEASLNDRSKEHIKQQWLEKWHARFGQDGLHFASKAVADLPELLELLAQDSSSRKDKLTLASALSVSAAWLRRRPGLPEVLQRHSEWLNDQLQILVKRTGLLYIRTTEVRFFHETFREYLEAQYYLRNIQHTASTPGVHWEETRRKLDSISSEIMEWLAEGLSLHEVERHAFREILDRLMSENNPTDSCQTRCLYTAGLVRWTEPESLNLLAKIENRISTLRELAQSGASSNGHIDATLQNAALAAIYLGKPEFLDEFYEVHTRDRGDPSWVMCPYLDLEVRYGHFSTTTLKEWRGSATEIHDLDTKTVDEQRNILMHIGHRAHPDYNLDRKERETLRRAVEERLIKAIERGEHFTIAMNAILCLTRMGSQSLSLVLEMAPKGRDWRILRSALHGVSRSDPDTLDQPVREQIRQFLKETPSYVRYWAPYQVSFAFLIWIRACLKYQVEDLEHEILENLPLLYRERLEGITKYLADRKGKGLRLP